jgi:Dyp-type peroxidase family
VISTTCTIIAPVLAERAAELRFTLQAIAGAPRDNGVLPLGEVDGLHYAAAMVHDDTDRSILILELNGDGTPELLVDSLLFSVPEGVAAILGCCEGWPVPATPDLVRIYIRARLRRAHAGHVGNVGRSLDQVLGEARLREAVLERLDAWRAEGSLPATSKDVAEKLRSWLSDSDDEWALTSPPPRRTRGERARFWLRFAPFLLLIPVIPLLPFAALWLFIRERLDRPGDPPRDDGLIRQLEDAEDQPGYVANHLVSVVPVKPGIGRRLLLRFVLAALDRIARIKFDEGRLGSIGSIHFAHWSIIDDGRNLLFCSNFDGSWESYLDDFIEKAARGLTAVWSNTVGFPRARWVMFDGATDGPRFKAWARSTQFPLGFWYSAYPGLTTGAIDDASALRIALATRGAPLPTWLAPDVSAPARKGASDTTGPDRPGIELAAVQALVLRSHKDLASAAYVMVRLPDDPSSARDWLAGVLPEVTSAEAASANELTRAVQLAVTASGLQRLGVDSAMLQGFSRPFLEGMVTEHRSRILGDVAGSDPTRWRWGGPADAPIDVLLAVFAADAAAVAVVASELTSGVEVLASVTSDVDPSDRIEHFGFVDGISQPILTGSPKAMTPNDPDVHRWNRLAAGEVVLGMSDEGEGPPPPPAGHRDDTLGPLRRDGTYLVIRQLHQRVATFRSWTLAAGDGDPAEAYRIATELVGRRTDGTPLVADAPGAPALGPEANDFGFRAHDAQGIGCPLGAHIRRANPRDSAHTLGADAALQSTRRHRILRRGRRYGPLLPVGALDDDGAERGLLFVGLVADIERQFEFVQHHWLNGQSFAGLGEVDPITGTQAQASGRATLQACPVSERHGGLVDFTETRGGAYLFLPSLPALARLASGL